jgi:hypothetical protein
VTGPNGANVLGAVRRKRRTRDEKMGEAAAVSAEATAA